MLDDGHILGEDIDASVQFVSPLLFRLIPLLTVVLAYGRRGHFALVFCPRTNWLVLGPGFSRWAHSIKMVWMDESGFRRENTFRIRVKPLESNHLCTPAPKNDKNTKTKTTLTLADDKWGVFKERSTRLLSYQLVPLVVENKEAYNEQQHRVTVEILSQSKPVLLPCCCRSPHREWKILSNSFAFAAVFLFVGSLERTRSSFSLYPTTPKKGDSGRQKQQKTIAQLCPVTDKIHKEFTESSLTCCLLKPECQVYLTFPVSLSPN